ncbi:efflux RND transporter periplasmic adaptor subunit [Vibrio crassostreae]|uniref:efflux RND transporter periplasmic adaptor subunit n=1 Tax=Vibrio crassostreae TaxID=246167 RepID=UPI0040698F45
MSLRKVITLKLVVFAVSSIVLCLSFIYVNAIVDSNKLGGKGTHVVSIDSITRYVESIGTIEAVRMIDVGASVSGEITELMVGIGDKVFKDQLLIEIDPTVSSNELKTAQNELKMAVANFNVSQERLLYEKEQLELVTHLVKVGSKTSQELKEQKLTYLESVASFQSSKLSKETAVLEVDSKKAQLTYTMIRSPIEGTVVSIHVDKGQTLVSTQQVSNLIKVASTDVYRIELPISEYDISNISIGSIVEFNILGVSKDNYTSKISSIELTPLDNSSKGVNYNVSFNVPRELSESARIGMSIGARIKTAEAIDVVTIPNQYIQYGANGVANVNVLVDGHVIAKTVELGLHDFLKSEIISGVEVGDVLILEGVN